MNFVDTVIANRILEADKCTLCETIMPEISDAIDEGWTPAFYVADKCYEIACPKCSAKYLRLDEDGEFELKPGYVKTFMDSSSSK